VTVVTVVTINRAKVVNSRTLSGAVQAESRTAAMFVPAGALEEFTGKTRPSAQARFLANRGLKFIQRSDGTIALRQEELDAYTLTGTRVRKRAWEPDLSVLDRT
jgi:hypothetical protein